ncbi:MAG TPA: N-acetylmuramoyl-L-alanine amidase [Steroidobacteraceae bacterium]|jgi:N-acetylmuramoyl-L-alanine amidase|nr:N-acetylmuramoyl-L-alanine amidase [Steroidobacteraceae bacterium]
MNRLMPCASVLLLAILWLQPAHAAVDVRAIRLWAGPDSTRVVIDLSAKAQHNLQLLHKPERVVLDVPGARLAKSAHGVPAGAGAVKRVRMSHSASGNLRLVFDLSRPSEAKSFLSKPNAHYGYRLVIDLSGVATPVAHAAKVTHGAHVAKVTHEAHVARVANIAGIARADRPVRPKHAPADARDLIIAVDAGHGGEDPGAIGKNGTREKDVVLAIARELAAKINAEAGMKAVLTRNGDYFVPLRDRMRRARAQQADLFVSIHADSIRDRSIDGSSVYILSQRGATDEASRWLAERENASDLIGGVSLDDKGDLLASVLLDVSQSASLNASQVAAEQVLHELNLAGQVRKHEVQQARFVVLKSPDIPSMLVETAYISNPQEELRLRTPGHQARLAMAIHRGVHDYFYANPPMGTRVAQLASAHEARPVLATSNPAGAGGAGN